MFKLFYFLYVHSDCLSKVAGNVERIGEVAEFIVPAASIILLPLIIVLMLKVSSSAAILPILLCVPWMVNIVLRNKTAREWKSLMCGVKPEALASGKVVWSNSRTEVSQTAKDCTDEQKLHMRHKGTDEQPHTCKVLNHWVHLCRCSSDNPKAIYLARGDPTSGSNAGEGSQQRS